MIWLPVFPQRDHTGVRLRSTPIPGGAPTRGLVALSLSDYNADTTESTEDAANRMNNSSCMGDNDF